MRDFVSRITNVGRGIKTLHFIALRVVRSIYFYDPFSRYGREWTDHEFLFISLLFQPIPFEHIQFMLYLCYSFVVFKPQDASLLQWCSYFQSPSILSSSYVSFNFPCLFHPFVIHCLYQFCYYLIWSAVLPFIHHLSSFFFTTFSFCAYVLTI